MPECETETVAVHYYIDAEINGVSGAQRSGPFGKSAAESAATAMLTRDNVNKVTIVKEAVL